MPREASIELRHGNYPLKRFRPTFFVAKRRPFHIIPDTQTQTPVYANTYLHIRESIEPRL
ncbi:hypothetical protein ALQ65_200264 [Pseudomonas syringae pv. coriandricola]|uniref:Uncharacterized protein n=1 Tax=Pseudomonas syringae pv. coriandricola TaxID=264453 RepID=A0A3M3JRQ6_9PSED|nr:hypothetical protein ALQ65_200264 [Pseudomonas syringae pv. coriandricola]